MRGVHPQVHRDQRAATSRQADRRTYVRQGWENEEAHQETIASDLQGLRGAAHREDWRRSSRRARDTGNMETEAAGQEPKQDGSCTGNSVGQIDRTGGRDRGHQTCYQL